MQNVLFLIPPSEGKTLWGDKQAEKLTFEFEKPLDIAASASEKDLKCKGKRYQEALSLNACIENSPTLPAIARYTGVMYDHIWYFSMSAAAKKFFDEHFLILSGMYGLLKPQDRIWNYKLPIETKGLYAFWREKIIKQIMDLKPKKVYLLLPWAYEKLLCLKKYAQLLHSAGIEIIKPDFTRLNGEKLTHNTKILRGQWIRAICEKN